MLRRGLAALLALGTVGCGAPAPPPATARAEGAAPAPPVETPAPAAPDVPFLSGFKMEQELEDVTFRQTRGTVTQWELHAVKVTEVPDAPAHLEGVTLRYFGDEPEPTVITAAEAEYDVETKSATLRGSVRITTPTGDSLESEELQWNAEAQTLNTEAEVTLRRGESSITGVGLRTSPGLQHVEMFQVGGVFREDALAG